MSFSREDMVSENRDRPWSQQFIRGSSVALKSRSSFDFCDTGLLLVFDLLHSLLFLYLRTHLSSLLGLGELFSQPGLNQLCRFGSTPTYSLIKVSSECATDTWNGTCGTWVLGLLPHVSPPSLSRHLLPVSQTCPGIFCLCRPFIIHGR